MWEDMLSLDQSRGYESMYKCMVLLSVALASYFVVFTEMGATGWWDSFRRRVGGQYESGK